MTWGERGEVKRRSLDIQTFVRKSVPRTPTVDLRDFNGGRVKYILPFYLSYEGEG